MHPGYYSWTSEIAAYIKSIDTSHLVMDGAYGIDEDSLSDPNIDIVSNHYYSGDYAANCITDRNTAKGKKPFIVGEFGITDAANMDRLLGGYHMLKKTVILLVAVSLFLSLFSGCGKQEKQEEGNTAAKTETMANSSKNIQTNENSGKISGNITYATNRTDIVDTLIRGWADKFQQKYPDVKVEIEGLKDYQKDIQTRIAAGEAPDVYMSQLSYFKKEQWPEYFMPLDDLGIKEDMSNFVEDSSYQGKLYIIPCMMSTMGFVYNKVAFKEAGVTEVPKTFNALMEACQKLKDKGIVPTSFIVKGGWTPDGYTNRLTTILDRNIFNEMEGTDEPFTKDNVFGKSMSYMLEFVKRGYVEKDQMSTTWDSFKKDLAEGKIAMGLFGEWHGVSAGTGKKSVRVDQDQLSGKGGRL